MKKKRLEKGSYGYIDAYRRRHLLISLSWLTVVAVIFIVGILVFKTKLNFATLAAMLILLSAVKAWIALIVMLPYHTDKKDYFEETKQLMAGKNAEVFSDIVMTKYEGSMMVSVLVLYDNNFFAYVPKKQKKSVKEIKTYLNSIITAAGATSKAMVFDEFDAFKKVIENLSSQENRDGKKLAAIRKQLFVTLV